MEAVAIGSQEDIERIARYTAGAVGFLVPFEAQTAEVLAEALVSPECNHFEVVHDFGREEEELESGRVALAGHDHIRRKLQTSAGCCAFAVLEKIR